MLRVMDNHHALNALPLLISQMVQKSVPQNPSTMPAG